MLSWLAPTLPRNRYKILPAQLLGGQNGTKLSLHAETAPNRAISGERGEFCTGHAARVGVRGEFCTGHAARTGVRGELCTGYAARVGVLGEFCTGYAASAGVQGEFCTGSVPCSSCWESFVPKGPGVVVVRRIMSCSGVVLVPVAGRSALAPLMGSAAESSVSWRSPRRRWGFCTTRSPLTECRRRVEPSCSAIPPDWWRRGRPKTADVQQRPARGRAGRYRNHQSGVLQCSVHGEHQDHHDRVIERVEQPRVGHILPGLHVHERQNDAERQV